MLTSNFSIALVIKMFKLTIRKFIVPKLDYISIL